MQSSLAAAGAWMLEIGLRQVTLIVIGGVLTATIISRLIYKGRSDPMLEDTRSEALNEVR